MFYDVEKYDCLNSESNYSLEQLENISKLYIKELNKKSNSQIIAKIDLKTLGYCKNIFYFNEPVWFVDLLVKIGRKNYYFYKTIIISDKNGRVYDAILNPKELNSNVLLSLHEVMQIAEEYCKRNLEKRIGIFRICKENVLYDICYKDSSGKSFPVWIIPIECENEKKFSDPNLYLHISDYSGTVISLINCHGREIME